MMLKEVERLGHKQFNRAFSVEALVWPHVELPGNSIEFSLSESGEISALGEILPEQAVGIFVDAPLPRAMDVGEVDMDAGYFDKSFILRHLVPLIIGQGQAASRVYLYS